MPQHIVCSRCRTPLVIRDYAPARLTCPRCLAPIRNPHARAARPAPAATVAPPAHPDASTPRRPPVLEYGLPATDREADADLRGTAYALAALGATLAAGALLSFAAGGRGTGTLLVLALLASAGTAAYYYHQQLRGLDPSTASRVAFSLVRGCAAALLLAVGLVVLLFGACAALLAGSAAFHG
jgi:hypothetical protein